MSVDVSVVADKSPMPLSAFETQYVLITLILKEIRNELAVLPLL